MINAIYKKITQHRYAIGHLKFLINKSVKISFTSNAQQTMHIDIEPAASAGMLINIRVQTNPDSVTRLVTAAIEDIEILSGCKITVNSLSAFQPGYPRPTYRID